MIREETNHAIYDSQTPQHTEKIEVVEQIYTQITLNNIKAPVNQFKKKDPAVDYLRANKPKGTHLFSVELKPWYLSNGEEIRGRRRYIIMSVGNMIQILTNPLKNQRDLSMYETLLPENPINLFIDIDLSLSNEEALAQGRSSDIATAEFERCMLVLLQPFGISAADITKNTTNADRDDKQSRHVVYHIRDGRVMFKNNKHVGQFILDVLDMSLTATPAENNVLFYLGHEKRYGKAYRFILDPSPTNDYNNFRIVYNIKSVRDNEHVKGSLIPACTHASHEHAKAMCPYTDRTRSSHGLICANLVTYVPRDRTTGAPIQPKLLVYKKGDNGMTRHKIGVKHLKEANEKVRTIKKNLKRKISHTSAPDDDTEESDADDDDDDDDEEVVKHAVPIAKNVFTNVDSEPYAIRQLKRIESLPLSLQSLDSLMASSNSIASMTSVTSIASSIKSNNTLNRYFHIASATSASDGSMPIVSFAKPIATNAGDASHVNILDMICQAIERQIGEHCYVVKNPNDSCNSDQKLGTGTIASYSHACPIANRSHTQNHMMFVVHHGYPYPNIYYKCRNTSCAMRKQDVRFKVDETVFAPVRDAIHDYLTNTLPPPFDMIFLK